MFRGATSGGPYSTASPVFCPQGGRVQPKVPGENFQTEGDLVPLCCCSVTQLCLILCDPRDCSMPGFPVLHHLTKLAQTHESEIPFNYLTLCYLLLLLPSIFPSIRVFSNESFLHIRWPKYWSFSLSISPSSEYSGLISFLVFKSPFKSFVILSVKGHFI